MDTVVIESKVLRVEAAVNGGGLCSVVDKRDGEELLYTGSDKRAWGHSDVMIFPFIGRLKDKRYTLGGSVYEMENHGVVRYKTFAPHAVSQQEAELSVCDDAETRAQFPFSFRFAVRYRVDGDRLFTTLIAENRSDRPMPMMTGGHQAYRLDAVERDSGTDTSVNAVVFSQKALTRYTLDPSGGFITGEEPFAADGPIALDKKLFAACKTLMLTGVSGKVEIRRPGRTLTYELGEPPVVAIWSHEKFGAYVCVEPWFGRPDALDPVRELYDKPSIVTLAPGAAFSYTYSVTFGARNDRP